MKKYNLNTEGKEAIEEFVQNIIFNEKTHGKEWAFGAITFAVDVGIITAEEAIKIRQFYEL